MVLREKKKSSNLQGVRDWLRVFRNHIRRVYTSTSTDVIFEPCASSEPHSLVLPLCSSKITVPLSQCKKQALHPTIKALQAPRHEQTKLSATDEAELVEMAAEDLFCPPVSTPSENPALTDVCWKLTHSWPIGCDTVINLSMRTKKVGFWKYLPEARFGHREEFGVGESHRADWWADTQADSTQCLQNEG